MSVLLRQWVCLDDGEVFANEDEYCAHAATCPKHRIVVDEDSPSEQWCPRFGVMGIG
jgi:hypothetical protein